MYTYAINYLISTSCYASSSFAPVHSVTTAIKYILLIMYGMVRNISCLHLYVYVLKRHRVAMTHVPQGVKFEMAQPSTSSMLCKTVWKSRKLVEEC